MSAPSLPAPILVADDAGLGRLAEDLARHPVVAVDTESNSLHAYRERVCLIQFSTPAADDIVDPLRLPVLDALAPLFANPEQQKVFHAAEYDILCLRRDYRFEFANIFDTMNAARALGWPQVGLAAILDKEFGVTMNKKYQRADWKRRPLTPEQLDYARLDTHYLGALRDRQFRELTASGHWSEAQEEFEAPGAPARRRGRRDQRLCRVLAGQGARDPTPAQAAVLRTLHAYREQQAERIDRPPFKIMAEAALLELARRAPRRADELHGIAGLTPDQVRRHAAGLLQAIEQGRQAPAETPPADDREPEDVLDRYDRLRMWRKDKAKARGVESDVILPRTALWELARRQPRTPGELVDITDIGPWRRQKYGEEILAALSGAAPATGRR